MSAFSSLPLPVRSLPAKPFSRVYVSNRVPAKPFSGISISNAISRLPAKPLSRVYVSNRLPDKPFFSFSISNPISRLPAKPFSGVSLSNPISYPDRLPGKPICCSLPFTMDKLMKSFCFRTSNPFPSEGYKCFFRSTYLMETSTHQKSELWRVSEWISVRPCIRNMAMKCIRYAAMKLVRIYFDRVKEMALNAVVDASSVAVLLTWVVSVLMNIFFKLFIEKKCGFPIQLNLDAAIFSACGTAAVRARLISSRLLLYGVFFWYSKRLFGFLWPVLQGKQRKNIRFLGSSLMHFILGSILGNVLTEITYSIYNTTYKASLRTSLCLLLQEIENEESIESEIEERISEREASIQTPAH